MTLKVHWNLFIGDANINNWIDDNIEEIQLSTDWLNGNKVAFILEFENETTGIEFLMKFKGD